MDPNSQVYPRACLHLSLIFYPYHNSHTCIHTKLVGEESPRFIMRVSKQFFTRFVASTSKDKLSATLTPCTLFQASQVKNTTTDDVVFRLFRRTYNFVYLHALNSIREVCVVFPFCESLVILKEVHCEAKYVGRKI